MGLRDYLIKLGKKMGWVALGWVILYFCTQWAGHGIGSLFGLGVGAVAGLVIGWWLAENAVEDAGFSGITLWVILVLASWLPIGVVERVLMWITGWPMEFGRWMLVTAALLAAMAATVWRASADD